MGCISAFVGSIYGERIFRLHGFSLKKKDFMARSWASSNNQKFMMIAKIVILQNKFDYEKKI